MFYASNLCTECLTRVISATPEFKSVRPISFYEKASTCRCGAEAVFVVIGTPELKNALSVERAANSEARITCPEKELKLKSQTDLIRKYSEKAASIYKARTAGDFTWEGLLGSFLREFLNV